MNDTIAAIATPLGKGAISIIKISGHNALNVLKQLTQNKTSPPDTLMCAIFFLMVFY